MGWTQQQIDELDRYTNRARARAFPAHRVWLNVSRIVHNVDMRLTDCSSSILIVPPDTGWGSIVCPPYKEVGRA